MLQQYLSRTAKSGNPKFPSSKAQANSKTQNSKTPNTLKNPTFPIQHSKTLFLWIFGPLVLDNCLELGIWGLGFPRLVSAAEGLPETDRLGGQFFDALADLLVLQFVTGKRVAGRIDETRNDHATEIEHQAVREGHD